jgi:O-antigen/teichoic acid export membrane protein
LTDSLKNKTVLGIKWNFVNQFGVQFLTLLFSIFLARLLGPAEYGLIAMVTVFTGFSNIFVDFGFGNALIFKEKPTKLDWSSVFWFNLLSGIVVFLILILLSGTIANFYDEPILKEITIVLSLSFIFSSASITYIARLKKQLNFKSISIINLGSIILSGIIGLFMAFNNFGVWSLVGQRLSNVILKLIGYLLMSKWLPYFKYSGSSIKEIFSYSSYLFLSKLLSYSSRNLDNLLIGKVIDVASLGLYNRAYSFLMFPITAITRVINSVMFPYFSKIKNDKERIRQEFITTAKSVSIVVVPLMLNFNLGSNEIVLLVFGEQWAGMVPFLKWFSFLGIYQTIIGLSGPLYTALGNTKLDFKIGLFTQTVNILGIVIGINWGIQGVIYGLYGSMMVNLFPVNYFILKTINLKMLDYFKEFIPIVMVNLIIYALVYFMFRSLPYSHALVLAIKVVTYSSLYLISLHFMKVKEYQILLNRFLKKINNEK